MSDDDNQISEEDKIKIAGNFLLHAPPGEFKEVFLDLRGLLSDDRILKKALSNTNSRYNQDQFVQCELDNGDVCLITEFNELQDGRYFDPRSKQSFKFDHLHFKTSEYEPYTEIDQLAEPWRSHIDKEFQQYIKIHYKNAACSVFGSSDQGHISIVICIEAHKYQPTNYWNARWRSRWAISFQQNLNNINECELDGVIKAQVHYYEDGNVQLVSQKEIKDKIRITDAEHTAKEVIKCVEKAENEYQNAISENYQSMSESTFKALRRALPVTKSRLDWTKISSYKIGSELKSSSSSSP